MDETKGGKGTKIIKSAVVIIGSVWLVVNFYIFYDGLMNSLALTAPESKMPVYLNMIGLLSIVPTICFIYLLVRKRKGAIYCLFVSVLVWFTVFVFLSDVMGTIVSATALLLGVPVVNHFFIKPLPGERIGKRERNGEKSIYERMEKMGGHEKVDEKSRTIKEWKKSRKKPPSRH